MYTGIVAGMCQVLAIEDGEEIRSFVVELGGHEDGLEIGASVALEGVCMTVVAIGSLEEGDWVNVERSLKMGDELGGHILSGHVMTTAQILGKSERGEGIDLIIENPKEARPYILEKGFIAVDGMSLTIGEVSDESFALHIIPETLRITTIGDKGVGGSVNIEIDSRTQAVVDTVMRDMEDNA
jgi:riboflavin synthase